MFLILGLFIYQFEHKYCCALQEARKALEGVPTIQSMSSKQLQYVLKVTNQYVL